MLLARGVFVASQSTQLIFDLPHRTAQGLEDFLVSPANEAAVSLIDTWPDWPHRCAVVEGPAGCGKSHLAHVWQLGAGAQCVEGTSIDETVVAGFNENKALVVEDIDRGIGNERVLFHVLNLARETDGYVLLTTRVVPGALSISLPDLRSRLRALPVVHVASPDEVLLKAVLVKLFTDRQLSIDPTLIEFLALRIERSMEAANNIVADIDRLALQTKRRVTRPLAQKALEDQRKAL